MHITGNVFESQREDAPPDPGISSTTCAICDAHHAIAPSVVGIPCSCPHVFCHYCVSANVAANPDFQCPRCGSSLAEGQIKRLRMGS